jgi:predicted enzyme related to lactoylglutathione lyase
VEQHLMGNAVLHWQIVSKNPAAAARFYSKLFEWQIDSSNALGYREVKTGNAHGIDGGIWPCPPDGQSLVQLFVEVDDVHAQVRKAEALGAKVIVPPSTLPEGDVMAILVDPAGLAFGVYKPGRPIAK